MWEIKKNISDGKECMHKMLTCCKNNYFLRFYFRDNISWIFPFPLMLKKVEQLVAQPVTDMCGFIISKLFDLWR